MKTKRSFRLIFRGFILVITLIILFLAVFLTSLTLNRYNPPKIESLYNKNIGYSIDGDRFVLLTWNIGYCGLGKNMDFFYDGGEKVRDSESNTKENCKQICKLLDSFNDLDFILLQEVDTFSKRSYGLNEFSSLSKSLKSYSSFFTSNYQSYWVPFPLSDPLGEVRSGLALFSKEEPSLVQRISYESSFKWPRSLFMPRRCFLVAEYLLKGGHKLFVINTHNSAFDDGNLRKAEVLQLKSVLDSIQSVGDYFIVAGDWNQMPVGVPNEFITGTEWFSPKPISKELFNDYKIVFDSTIASNRFLDRPFSGDSKTTIIDFAVLSRGVDLVEVNTVDLGFRYSDHNPVRFVFSINPGK